MFRSKDLIRFLRHSKLPGKFRIAKDIVSLFLRKAPCTEQRVNIGHYTLISADGQLLRELLWEVFICERYDMGELRDGALIVDAGANIGVAALYFSLRYPSSKVHCFEPEPKTFQYLAQNVQGNQLDDVVLHHEALSDQEGRLKMFVRNDTAGDIGATTVSGYRECYHSASQIEEIEVPCVRLSDKLSLFKQIDILKVDIEGGEASLFRDMETHFSQVERVVMEYHGMPGNKNPLGNILRPLESANFQVILDGERRINWPDSYELFLRARRDCEHGLSSRAA